MDRSRITPEVVRCLLESQFPQWADLRVTPVDLEGWDNVTFRLGDGMSVRLPGADGYEPQIDKERRWLPRLAERLPLEIPQPLGRGEPGCGYPREWSVYRWLEGQPATAELIDDLGDFAIDLADFLGTLYSIDPVGGPPAGEHSFFRGGPLVTYDDDTRAAVSRLSSDIDLTGALSMWEEALASEWEGPPVWVHGDVTPSNLLVVDGHLSAVIDFGSSAVGDPACDTTIAWTFLFGQSRAVFIDHLPVDEGTWVRGRGWALWKALITEVEARDLDRDKLEPAWKRFGWRHSARSVIDDLLGNV